MSAPNITLPLLGDTFQITGDSGTITRISAGDSNKGRKVTLIFASTQQLNTGGSLNLAGALWSAVSNSTIQLVCDGNN